MGLKDKLIEETTLRGKLENWFPKELENKKKKINAYDYDKAENGDSDPLSLIFEELAKAFLYGGYIKIGQFRLYITTVEFYFHCEDESPYKIKDPIVYHRDYHYKNDKENTVPYFDMMKIHHHQIGYDITFENHEEKYRASVLIREYAIYDEMNQRFKILKRGSIFDNRITELQNHISKLCPQQLNEKSWKWVDEEEERYPENDMEQKKRVNVCEYKKENGEYKRQEKEYIKDKNKKCTRKWSFYRNAEIYVK